MIPSTAAEHSGGFDRTHTTCQEPRASMPPSSAALLRGVLLAGKYRLERPLAEGGMGTVWLAHNEELELDVAIKVIRADLQVPNLPARLLNEARAAARLKHPGIVRVLDYGSTEDGQPYLVMERLTGLTLHEHLEIYGRLEPKSAVALLLPAAAALDAAHRKKVVHRDFKPENLILAQGDDDRIEPKVVDFGVATPVRPLQSRLTAAGGVVGSPQYLSPEQAMGEEGDHRSDVWGFAVVLYETLSKQHPFIGDNYHALLQLIIHSAPIPLNRGGLVDDALWSIIARGLNKDPAQRWATMREFGVALAQWLLARDVVADVSGLSITATWLRAASASDLLRQSTGRNTATVAPSTSTLTHRVAPSTSTLTNVTGTPRPAGSGGRSTLWMGIIAGLAAGTIGATLLAWESRADQEALSPTPRTTPSMSSDIQQSADSVTRANGAPLPRPRDRAGLNQDAKPTEALAPAAAILPEFAEREPAKPPRAPHRPRSQASRAATSPRSPSAPDVPPIASEAGEPSLPTATPLASEGGKSSLPTPTPPASEGGKSSLPTPTPPASEGGKSSLPTPTPPASEGGKTSLPTPTPPASEGGKTSLPTPTPIPSAAPPASGSARLELKTEF